MEIKPHQRIIFPLDVPTRQEAWKYIDLLQGHVGMFKIGLELFIAEGPNQVQRMTRNGIPVMLDLKLHDIPETVRRAALSAGELGVKFLTLHVQQREALMAATEAAKQVNIQLLGVTVLTSMSDRDCKDLRYNPADCTKRVKHLASFASDCGITGFVCSPQEVSHLRKGAGSGVHNSILVVPGIRPDNSVLGDQKRTGTPAQAIRDGADYLVIGRPIRDAKDPVAAAQAIAYEIEQPQER